MPAYLFYPRLATGSAVALEVQELASDGEAQGYACAVLAEHKSAVSVDIYRGEHPLPEVRRDELGLRAVSHRRSEDLVVVEHRGTSWAVRHNGGFLGYTGSLEEAVLVAQDLIDWIASNGGSAALIVGAPQSFAESEQSAGTAQAGAITPRGAAR